MGHMTFAIMAGSLDADDISIADDPEFSNVPFIQAKKLNVGVEVLPIMFHHRVHITKLRIDTPSIQLIQNAAGTWNFSSIGRAKTQQPSSVPDLERGRAEDYQRKRHGIVNPNHDEAFPVHRSERDD